MSDQLKNGFEASTVQLRLERILPLRVQSVNLKRSLKYAQIVASIREVGIIEPPVVVRHSPASGKFRLLDGHLRVEALKSLGIESVVCLVAADDESYTYNKHVNRLAPIQEHKMILRAIERGVSEERLSRALNLDIAGIRSRRRLLEGISPEVAELLGDKDVPLSSFTELRRMRPGRQLEAAQLMVAMNCYRVAYARSLVVASSADQLVEAGSGKAARGLSEERIALMEQESARLQTEFRSIEKDYGADHLDLVLALGYVSRLLGNARVVGYLAQCHPEMLAEFQKLSEFQKAA